MRAWPDAPARCAVADHVHQHRAGAGRGAPPQSVAPPFPGRASPARPRRSAPRSTAAGRDALQRRAWSTPAARPQALTAVSCASATFCAAVGANGRVVTLQRDDVERARRSAATRPDARSRARRHVLRGGHRAGQRADVQRHHLERARRTSPPARRSAASRACRRRSAWPATSSAAPSPSTAPRGAPRRCVAPERCGRSRACRRRSASRIERVRRVRLQRRLERGHDRVGAQPAGASPARPSNACFAADANGIVRSFDGGNWADGDHGRRERDQRDLLLVDHRVHDVGGIGTAARLTGTTWGAPVAVGGAARLALLHVVDVLHGGRRQRPRVPLHRHAHDLRDHPGREPSRARCRASSPSFCVAVDLKGNAVVYNGATLERARADRRRAPGGRRLRDDDVLRRGRQRRQRVHALRRPAGPARRGSATSRCSPSPARRRRSAPRPTSRATSRPTTARPGARSPTSRRAR